MGPVSSEVQLMRDHKHRHAHLPNYRPTHSAHPAKPIQPNPHRPPAHPSPFSPPAQPNPFSQPIQPTSPPKPIQPNPFSPLAQPKPPKQNRIARRAFLGSRQCAPSGRADWTGGLDATRPPHPRGA
ncbi:protein TRACHEARY ELEMENT DIFFERENTIATION-RELATED 7-like [Penaeus chinensis]|uniref:protein TRACHEARY ELEMENT DIFFERENTIATION-RELATED 7-like n=1 Tax=Penaeus chinensis TaxID=139456 RepID=UPI001FB6A3CD|nr:protein TRACHEARY ELEMENT DIFFERENTIATION-RELATED 7-like [Penaeus chinensis]